MVPSDRRRSRRRSCERIRKTDREPRPRADRRRRRRLLGEQGSCGDAREPDREPRLRRLDQFNLLCIKRLSKARRRPSASSLRTARPRPAGPPGPCSSFHGNGLRNPWNRAAAEAVSAALEASRRRSGGGPAPRRLGDLVRRRPSGRARIQPRLQHPRLHLQDPGRAPLPGHRPSAGASEPRGGPFHAPALPGRVRPRRGHGAERRSGGCSAISPPTGICS